MGIPIMALVKEFIAKQALANAARESTKTGGMDVTAIFDSYLKGKDEPKTLVPGPSEEAPSPTPQVDVAPPRGLAGFMQSAGHSAIGKDVDMTGRGFEGYLGQTVGDIFRTGARLPTSSEIGEQARDTASDAFDDYLSMRRYQLDEKKAIQAFGKGELETVRKKQLIKKGDIALSKLPPELKSEVDEALEASKGDTAMLTDLYQRLAAEYPEYASKLKTIMLPKTTLIQQNIMGELDEFFGGN